MKRFFILLLTIMLSFSIKAQHMTFMGVNMGQKLNSFCEQMKQKGLNQLYTGTNVYGDYATFSGTFWEYDNVTFLVRQSPSFSTVTEITIYDIRTNQVGYDRLVSNLSKKYGRYVVKNASTLYAKSCEWNTQKGSITVSRTRYSKDDYKCGIEIVYTDRSLVQRNKANNKIKSKQHSNDL